MNHENIELNNAHQVILLCADLVQEYDHQDWEAAIIALLARAIEVASDRKLRSIDEIFQKP